jgi:hypothetical protein
MPDLNLIKQAKQVEMRDGNGHFRKEESADPAERLGTSGRRAAALLPDGYAAAMTSVAAAAGQGAITLTARSLFPSWSP